MSHFTTVKTKITDIECLKNAIIDMGYTYEENKNEIKGYELNKTQARLLIKPCKYFDIGFCFNGQTFDIVADWWGIEKVAKIKEDPFIPELTQKYAYHKTKKTLAELGFIISQEEIENEKDIVLTVRQW